MCDEKHAPNNDILDEMVLEKCQDAYNSQEANGCQQFPFPGIPNTVSSA
jgi:hypothetical protein